MRGDAADEEPGDAARRAGCCGGLCLPLGRGRARASEYAPPPQQPSPAAVAAPPPAQGLTLPPPHAQGAHTVHMVYYENRAKCCKKLLRHNGHPNKVLLFPEEGWARSASTSYWTLTPSWWNRSRCHVVEVAGTRRNSAQAKMVDTGTGNLYIVGSFKRMSPDPDFKLFLTSNVSPSDFNMGYSMTGTLERGSRQSNCFQMTHFAVIRRRDHDK